jgi:uncharacterized protein YcbK (DUF882 family)
MKVPRFFRRKIFRILPLLVLSIVLLTYLFSSGARRRFVTFFNTSCKEYKQALFSRKLNDIVPDYIDQARLTGIKPCRNEDEIRTMARKGKLFKVRERKGYEIDRLTHSYPYLTRDSRKLMRQIGRRFRAKTREAGLSGAEMIITSMTRTTEKVQNLRRDNGNASANSPHLNGNAFDISYVSFNCRKLKVTSCDKRFMKEALAEIIYELRSEKRCWATYERGQTCFHVVSRR